MVKWHPPTVASDSSTLDNVYFESFYLQKIVENIGMKVLTAINFLQDHFNKAVSKADDKIKGISPETSGLSIIVLEYRFWTYSLNLIISLTDGFIEMILGKFMPNKRTSSHVQ